MVGETAGEEYSVDAETLKFEIEGKYIGQVYETDTTGNFLPKLRGKFEVSKGYVLPIATSARSFDGKQKLNVKKLSLITLLVFISGNYRVSEFVLNAVIGFTVFQALSFFSKSKCEARQNWLPMVYVTMAIYYTLRMTLVFDVPEILMPIHEGYMSAGKFLSENQIVEWIILMNLFSKPEKFINYEAESLTARAAQKWDEREGEIIVQNYNLRRLLVGMLAVVMFMTVGLVYKALSSNVMPYIVEVDTTTDMVRNVGTVEET